MNYRESIVWQRRQYTADLTEPIDINVKDPISRLTITYEPDNNPSGANATAHPVRCLTKIELVDGSDTLYSLSGAEGQGVDFYERGKVTPSILCYLNGMYSEMVLNLNFGRFLFDPMLALLPEKFSNLALNVSIDIDGGGDEANDGYLTVLAHLFDDKAINPVGFLMHKEIKSYTLADASPEYTSLPLDFPYQQIYLRAQRYGTGPEYQVDTVKLSEDTDKKIPVNLTMFQILRNIAQEWPPYREWILVPGMTSAQYFYNTPCYWPTFTDTQWRAAVATAEASIYGGDGGRFQHDAEAAGPNHQIHCMGWAPHAVVPILPGFPQDPDNFYALTREHSLEIEVVGASSVGTSQTAQILATQLRRY